MAFRVKITNGLALCYVSNARKFPSHQFSNFIVLNG
jgi:hypothetical protein